MWLQYAVIHTLRVLSKETKNSVNHILGKAPPRLFVLWLGSPAMPVTSCFVISVPHPAEEKDIHLTLMLTSAPLFFPSAFLPS